MTKDCKDCGHARDRHEIEPPYPCYDCDCESFAHVKSTPPAETKAVPPMTAKTVLEEVAKSVPQDGSLGKFLKDKLAILRESFETEQRLNDLAGRTISFLSREYGEHLPGERTDVEELITFAQSCLSVEPAAPVSPPDDNLQHAMTCKVTPCARCAELGVNGEVAPVSPEPPRPVHYWNGYGNLCMTEDGRKPSALCSGDTKIVTCERCLKGLRDTGLVGAKPEPICDEEWHRLICPNCDTLVSHTCALCLKESLSSSTQPQESSPLISSPGEVAATAIPASGVSAPKSGGGKWSKMMATLLPCGHTNGQHMYAAEEKTVWQQCEFMAVEPVGSKEQK